MKKTIFLLLLVGVVSLGASAQLLCTGDIQVIDTTYPSYFFDRPCPTNGVYCYLEEHFFDGSDSIEFIGERYFSREPVSVYGIAGLGGFPHNRIFCFALATMANDTGGRNLVYLASKRYQHYERGPKRSMYVRRTLGLTDSAYECIPLDEIYFENPIVVKDTFYVGFLFNDGPFSVCARMRGLSLFDSIPIFSTTPENLIWWGNGRRYYPLTKRSTCWGGFYPIIQPYEGDSLVCDEVHKFHLESRGPSYPTFAWDTSSLWEQDTFELQYAQYGTDRWTTRETASSSLRVIAVFDPTKYYQARIRARCHHLCPGHDTVLYSPWSDTILFYTGGTEPDTTSGIAVVEGSEFRFTLTPNPATGKTRVALGLGGSSGAAEPMRLTVCDAAGQVVLRQEVAAGQEGADLDLSCLAAGTYLVTLATPTASGTQRLVVGE